MSLPEKTSNARRVLDLFRGVRYKSKSTVFGCLSDISRGAISAILADQVEKGHLGINSDGYRLTALANKKYDQEAADAVLVPSAFKPRGVQPSWRDNLPRPGSDAFFDLPSRHVEGK